ncbi:MAG: hypothetical protein JXQ90_20735 [Cyclobacteriaceae bacterium]
MRRTCCAIIIGIALGSCRPETPEALESNVPKLTSNITIFEVYLDNPASLDQLSTFLKDTLGLPTEWNSFDLFGDSIVYDEAFFLGNTTFELVTLYQGDTTMDQLARCNRIIFGVPDIEKLSIAIRDDFQHAPPSDFNIVSGGKQITMGRQTNLDSLSKASGFYVSFWQYLQEGFSFSDRAVNAVTKEELYEKLGESLASNTIGIKELKEVHLILSQKALGQWHKLLGPSVDNHWKMKNGPIISYDIGSSDMGIQWITLSVEKIEMAKRYLEDMEILSERDGKVSISRTEDFGLKVFMEE